MNYTNCEVFFCVGLLITRTLKYYLMDSHITWILNFFLWVYTLHGSWNIFCGFTHYMDSEILFNVFTYNKLWNILPRGGWNLWRMPTNGQIWLARLSSGVRIFVTDSALNKNHRLRECPHCCLLTLLIKSWETEKAVQIFNNGSKFMMNPTNMLDNFIVVIYIYYIWSHSIQRC